MEREDFRNLKIIDIQVAEYKEETTFYFISDTNENEHFLNEVLHQNKFEINKKKDANGDITVWLFFPIPNFMMLLNPDKKIEEILGYKKILNDEYEYVNTMIWGRNRVPLTNFHQKIRVH